MRTFIFGCNEQTWTYFLPAVEDLIASSGNILRCLLAMRTILPTPRVVVRPRRQDDQPNSDARTRSKLSTSACQCYHSRWSWGNVVSDQLLTIIPADKLKDPPCLRSSLMAAVAEATLEATFSSPASAAGGREFEAAQRLLPAEKSIEDSGLTELWIHRRRELAQTPKILMLINFHLEIHEQLTKFVARSFFLSQYDDIHQK